MTSTIPPEVRSRPICELGLTIEGSRLEPVVATFLRELQERGLDRVQPRLYLSTEWGVPEGTRSIAIPFYLVSDTLMAHHLERFGHVEGRSPADVLRYLRHEMGHVINYAYRLFESPEWVSLFGPISLPYRELYHPVPFSRDFVRHLPGWYAQKHPDEDWSETFAVWMTPGLDWRSEYADWPVALGKLNYCHRTTRGLSDREPFTITDEVDEDVSEVSLSLDEIYAANQVPFDSPGGLDSALPTIFEAPDEPSNERLPADRLIFEHASEIASEVYRWTGRFPEWTWPVLRHLAARSEAIGLGYPNGQEPATLIRLTAYLTALACHSPTD